jgi:hypothetical protein
LPVGLPWMGLVVLSLLVSAGTMFRGGLPDPHIHDEYSNLLAADTFAHGRLTNPTHPMWKYLQTFYVLQRPTYQSKYPPGQGLVLAMGQMLTGEPIVGVWIITAALVLAAAWMLAGFVETRWAIAGAAALAVHPQIVEWSRIYWGGTAAALGGALVLGGWTRARGRVGEWVRGRWIAAAAIGIGLGILLNTRPYEGFAAVVPVLLAMLWRFRSTGVPPVPGAPRQGRDARATLALSVFIAFTPIALWTGYYNFRVTGNPVKLPYTVYEQQYAAAPPLLVQPLRPVPADIPPEMREYAEKIEIPHFQQQRTLAGFLSSASNKLRELLGDIVGVKAGTETARVAGSVIFVFAVLTVLAVHRDRRLWMPVAMIACTVTATLLSNWTRSQYVAPATGALLVLLVAAARELERRVNRAGWCVVTAALIVFAAISCQAAGDVDTGSGRARIVASLANEKGKQLVLVRYLPGHRPDDEWVENAADIDAAQTVWARDPGPGADQALLGYFHDRTVWRLTVGQNGVSIGKANQTETRSETWTDQKPIPWPTATAGHTGTASTSP